MSKENALDSFSLSNSIRSFCVVSKTIIPLNCQVVMIIHQSRHKHKVIVDNERN